MILCVGGTPAVQRPALLWAGARRGEQGTRGADHSGGQGSERCSGGLRPRGTGALDQLFLGGDPGRFVARKLDAEGVPHEVVWVEDDAPTRTCTTLLPEDGVGTELVEETSSVSARHVRKLESAVTGHLHEARVLCLISSLPPGVPGDFYARLTKAAHEAHLPCS